MSDQQQMEQALDRAQAALNTMRALLASSSKGPGNAPSPTLASQKSSSTPPSQKGKRKLKISTAESLPADKLGPAPSKEGWPLAVQPTLIVKGSGEKQFRAIQISRLLGNFDGKTVLDVGCDEGYLSREIGARAKKVVAYDLKPAKTWDKFKTDTLSFTADKVEVEGAQYDIIVLYDVLDHLAGEDPVKFMAWLNSLLAQGGKVVVRCHPWTSRHGSHLYENGHNHAFYHLALTPDELVQEGVDLQGGFRINRPMAAYEHIFKGAGFKIVERKAFADAVEPFFSGEVLDRIIKVTWKGEIDQAGALKIMSNSFIDYTLGAE